MSRRSTQTLGRDVGLVGLVVVLVAIDLRLGIVVASVRGRLRLGRMILLLATPRLVLSPWTVWISITLDMGGQES